MPTVFECPACGYKSDTMPLVIPKYDLRDEAERMVEGLPKKQNKLEDIMSIFSQYPQDEICPICKTNKNKETILIPISSGAQKDNLVECVPFHLQCVLQNLRYSKDINIIYIKVR
jgi:rubredoxin